MSRILVIACTWLALATVGAKAQPAGRTRQANGLDVAAVANLRDLVG